MEKIDVGEEFYYRLANRNNLQGNGKHTAESFRKKYLQALDNEEAWEEELSYITFDFKNVKRIGPSFANEAFAYFMKYTDPETFLKKVVFINIDEVDKKIIRKELDSGYKR